MKSQKKIRNILFVSLVALFIATLTLIPFWRAQLNAPAGWQFTGNLLTSPDMMQYRVWMRQGELEGPVVENKFTSEANQPHLIIFFYFLIGKIAGWSHSSPEWVYAYLGALLGFVYMFLLFAFVRQYFKDNAQAAWVFAIVLFGGGLGTYLKIIQGKVFFQQIPILNRTIIQAVWNNPVFEDFRGNYLFRALFDPHFLLLWLVFTLTMFVLLLCLKRTSTIRLILVAGLSLFVVLLHIYEGVTLLAILAATAFFSWRKHILNYNTAITLTTSTLAALAGMGFIFYLYSQSSLPLPTWVGVNMLFSNLLLAYPLAWLMYFIGISGYWQKAGLEEVFLLGWSGGCVLVFLSAPYFPYSDRGTLTLQIPLYLVAGTIYFTRFKRITVITVLVVLMTIMVTPTWMVYNSWKNTTFSPETPALFVNAEHRQLIDLLKDHSGRNDLLVADLSKVDWMRDLLWLAPEYPGRHYCGHFFLCVDYTQKRNELIHFYQADPEEKAKFMDEIGARFVFVGPEHNFNQFEQTPGLELLLSNSEGAIFEYQR